MSNLSNPRLLEILVCPACGANLVELPGCLHCSRCSSEYEVRSGIPLLYPADMDTRHLAEEENLASMMKDARQSPDELFMSSQWALSKHEFWAMVKQHVQSQPGLLVNLGCGYDSSFVELEQAGHTFVNFDMVYGMLQTLQSSFGARTCVAGDVKRLPFKEGVFDYIISIDLIHHEANELLRLLQSFQRLLKPGGMLFLEDPNAWGMFQIPKSILLPQFLYRSLRSAYHRLTRRKHGPADYEFPTNVYRVRAMLRRLGIENIQIYPHTAYPCISQADYRIYNRFSRFEHVRKYHNYHYALSGTKPLVAAPAHNGSPLAQS